MKRDALYIIIKSFISSPDASAQIPASFAKLAWFFITKSLRKAQHPAPPIKRKPRMDIARTAATQDGTEKQVKYTLNTR